MSIKSQKSLNEECSEIFEKSYSVRSLSEESIATDDDACLARELLSRLSPAALSRLRRRFRRAGGRAAAVATDRVDEAMCAAAQREGVEFEPRAAHPSGALSLDEEGFVNAIDEIFGRNRYSAHARQLCLVLDPLRSGRVLWWALLDKLVPTRGAPSAPTPTPARAHRPTRLPHCQRDCIVKLVSVEREGTFCYVAVTRGGRVGVYSGHLQLLHAYEVFQQRAATRRRIKNCWVTDAVYMSDAACVAYATSERCVRVFAAPTPTHTPLHCITGLPDLPTCLAYSPCCSWAGGSVLVAGTARGTLCTLRFLRPRAALLQHATDAPSYCSWTELCSGEQRAYCSARASPVHVHSQPVRRVMCERDARRVLSCSHDAACSLRVRNASQHLDDYLFKVQRGVSCFHVVWALQLVATGSSDGVVRLWEPTQSAPYARLARPGAAPLLDLALLAHRVLLVAFHNNCILNIWDLHEECLVQSIKIKFPFLGVLGKKVEFGAYSIHPGPARKESTEDNPVESSSRRGSQAYRGTSGGLLLEEDQEPIDIYSRDLKSDPEYVRFNRPELLITCCDYVCRVTLGVGVGEEDENAVLPPPRDTLRARRPSYWELPEDFISNTDNVLMEEGGTRRQLSAPEPQNIDRLLESAGLQGLLEKDFVLMRGLKHDLNKKLNEVKINMNAGWWAVRCGAPHLALRPHSPPPPRPPRATLADYCAGLTLKFPPPSLAPTPSGSAGSTPTHSKAAKY